MNQSLRKDVASRSMTNSVDDARQSQFAKRRPRLRQMARACVAVEMNLRESRPSSCYRLVFKGNHRQAQELLAEAFREDLPPQAGSSEHHTSEVRKGWLEERRLELVPTNFGVEGFVGVKQVGKLTRYRYHKRKRQEFHETVYLITNLSPQEANVCQVLTWLRGHWAIENLHRTRDVQMKMPPESVRDISLPCHAIAIIGLLKRRGHDSVKRATEQFQTPTLALDLIARAI